MKPAVSGRKSFSSFTFPMIFLVTSPNSSDNHPIQTPVRGGPTRLAGK
jgi:hypothetical protein